MKNSVLLIIYFAAYYLGIIQLFYSLNRRRQRVLVFHHIIPDKFVDDSFEQRIVCTAESRFEKIMAIVNNRFRVTTDICVPNTAVITFDDGYRAALIADKVLSKYGNNAYFFIPVDNIGAGPLWIDHAMLWFAHVADGEYTINGDTFVLTTQSSRQRAFSQSVNKLYVNYDADGYIEQLDNLSPFSSLQTDEEYAMLRLRGLTAEELDLLKLKGHKIGAHSRKHDILSKLPPNELEDDFRSCYALVHTTYNTDIYAYPYGHPRDVSEQVVGACRKSGFSKAFINETNTSPTDFTIGRLNVGLSENKYEIEARLSGFTEWLKTII